ncbi:MAG: metallophosphoesterase [Chloroherpetonaceae bacterium]|nr:metallophosphoesterase [Chloroherpetonaceae bacterium]MCS7210419.1 metallophosphoesterase [Chloroherpetonaceae bacterium]MDW8019476.1 metallophosphoesterase [Chloroherpetonaceae bacterium]MDW8465582.1 metallophosphoesterase [Chloroherpetonaceae bacterium]
MPKLTILNLLLYIGLHLTVGFYLFRKVSQLLSGFDIKDRQRVRKWAGWTVASLMSLPTLGFALNRIEELRGSLLNNTIFLIGSAWILWVMIALVLLVPADVLMWLLRRLYAVWQYILSYARLRRPAESTAPALLRVEDAPLATLPAEDDVVTVVMPQLSRRAFLRQVAPLALGFAAPSVITGYSLLNNRTEFIINRMTLRFPDLPLELQGLKIAHLSDIHSGIYMPERKMEEIAEAVNALQPDLVAMTGDFIMSHRDEIEPFVRAFVRLRSTFGTFACAGNHDEWVGLEHFEEAMRQHRQRLLRNETAVLCIDGVQLNVIGVDFARSNPHLLKEALKTAHPEGFKLLLCHYPDYFTTAKQAGVDLMLAGHTHGGQIALDLGGISLYPIDLFYKYPRGLYEEGKQKLYVNLGVGFSATPIRTVQPEIALITLARL